MYSVMIKIITIFVFAVLFPITTNAGDLSSISAGLGKQIAYNFREVPREKELYPTPYIIMVEKITPQIVLNCRKDPNCMDIGLLDDDDKQAYTKAKAEDK